MKKTLLIFLSLLLTLLVSVSCGAPQDTEGESMTGNETEALTEAEADCDHAETDETDRVEPMALADGSVTRVCRSCGHTETETLPATKTLKVLAIGNSFSADAVAHLKGIMTAAGMKSFVIGNAAIGGCSLDKHWSLARSGAAEYGYSKQTHAGKTSKTSSLEAAVTDESWDVIVLQQVSNTSGVPSTYANLDNMINFVTEKATNPDVKLLFHMTWAYQNGFQKAAFAENYNNDQLTMYNAIADTVASEVMSKDAIVDVIPSGTAVQNLRTSYLGDTITRDGTHMSYDIGRYTVGLTWLVKLTGASLDNFWWVPDEYPAVLADIAVIKEAVMNAVNEPLLITESQYPTIE